MLIIYILTVCTIIGSVYSLNEPLIEKIDRASAAATATVESIKQEWQLDKFPLFLKSCFMHKLSWELMKLKFERKILSALNQPSDGPKTKFVISFTGSSVTAGHDSHFNASTPVVTGVIMRPAFEALGIELDSRNVALGNNPCTPYDVCVKYFSGLDADIVHWEQTYFCADRRPIIEQFIRQALTIPSKPIVVFSDSHSGKWKEDLCDTKASSHELSEGEKALLKLDTVTLVSETNKGELQARWSWLTEHLHTCHTAGIQTFQHLNHEAYACEGPYIREWNKGAASWHPSVIAHRMRAAHHAYFWLLNYAEALASVKEQLSHRVFDAVEKDVDHRWTKLHTPMGPAKHASMFPDEAQCLTDYEPRPVREASLKDKVVGGLAKDGKAGWTHMIYEDIVDHNLVLRSQKMGYLDFKHLMHGNKDAGPLSIALTLNKDSPIFVCETPGIWGSLPKGYDHLWSGIVEAYLTLNVQDQLTTGFTFKKESAQKLEITYDKANELCVTVKVPGQSSSIFSAGKHVLTIVGVSATEAIIAWIITG